MTLSYQQPIIIKLSIDCTNNMMAMVMGWLPELVVILWLFSTVDVGNTLA
jgi:hypothetical protein